MLQGTKRTRLTTRASVHLDMVRGAAALAVLVGHVRGLLFLPYHELPRGGVATSALYALTSLGHQAVIVFFVLSGFFIVSSVADAFEGLRWSWRAYLVNRVVRLSLVLAPALVLTLVVDRLGMAIAASAEFYRRPLAYFFAVPPGSLDTARNFFGNLFYLQGILVRPFGSNDPLWSLSYEFWYYLLFPLALCAWLKRRRPAMSTFYLLLAVSVVLFVGETIALYFLLWLLGGAIAYSFRRRRTPLRVPYAGAWAAVPFAAALAASVDHVLSSAFLMDSVVALGFAVWMYTLVHGADRPVPQGYARAARFFAGFSYTLYATHFPLLFLFRARIVRNDVWTPDWLHILCGLAIVVVTVVIAWGIAQLTEARTAAVRQKAMSLLTRGAPVV